MKNMKAEKDRSSEVFMESKSKKKWLHKMSSEYCFMLFPRSLYITNLEDRYWDWKCFKETSEDNVEVVKLRTVCWLDVRGKFKMSDLTPGITYNISYVVKLTKSSSGWELPMTLKLAVPGKTDQFRQVSLLKKPKGEWFELNLGNVNAVDNENGEICFDFYERGGHWKTGLLIKGVIIKPIVLT
ncbi:Phloem protein 2-A1 [Heracleum sosnowskyi]|uniref:Phloem protein 2-A1 n=2 Tax=Heracleum sosnowskyi TaxID=360622 RepID=A0AAD8N3Q2_9APIA|nr:Phloem protein 2-A1 [Heracleum sosnowskyi]